MAVSCSACGAPAIVGAAYCAKCGAPLGGPGLHIAASPRAAPIPQAVTQATPEGRYVSIPLSVGIVLLPVFFVWFLLREGYSQRARTIGFGWTAVWLVLYFTYPRTDLATPTQSANASADNGKTNVAPPMGVDRLAWGDKPGPDLKVYMKETGEGISLYVPKAKPKDFDGVPVSEQDFSFERGKLFAGDYYFSGGEATRDALLMKLTDTYGEPKAHNDLVHSWTWEWPDQKISVRLYYNEDHRQTTVTYSHD